MNEYLMIALFSLCGWGITFILLILAVGQLKRLSPPKRNPEDMTLDEVENEIFIY